MLKKVFVTTAVLIVLGLITIPLAHRVTHRADPVKDYLHCTIFNSNEGDLVLAGNNEDNTYADDGPTISIITADQNHSHGCLAVHYDRAAKLTGGMNDQGLFYDGNAVPATGYTPDPNKQTFSEGTEPLRLHILRTCASIDDVQAVLADYNEPVFATAQHQWVDATGASMICGWNGDAGEQQCLVKSGVPYQASSNFNAFTEEPDSRYNTAMAKLEYWQNISVAGFTYILSLVHQSNTLYSNVNDLVARKMYIYYHHPSWPDMDFNNVAVVDLADELALGDHFLSMDPEELDQANSRSLQSRSGSPVSGANRAFPNERFTYGIQNSQPYYHVPKGCLQRLR